jgi:hypothetical protein
MIETALSRQQAVLFLFKQHCEDFARIMVIVDH